MNVIVIHVIRTGKNFRVNTTNTAIRLKDNVFLNRTCQPYFSRVMDLNPVLGQRVWFNIVIQYHSMPKNAFC